MCFFLNLEINPENELSNDEARKSEKWVELIGWPKYYTEKKGKSCTDQDIAVTQTVDDDDNDDIYVYVNHFSMDFVYVVFLCLS